MDRIESDTKLANDALDYIAEYIRKYRGRVFRGTQMLDSVPPIYNLHFSTQPNQTEDVRFEEATARLARSLARHHES